MPRTIEFDRDDVLRRAMAVFWRQGYHATSVKDLTAATRLQPGSLYGTFQNKRTLFISALDTYFAEIRQRIEQCLYTEESPLVRLMTFFEMLIDESACDPDNKGCLLVNTLLEIPADDTEINQRVSTMFAEVEREFAHILQEAKSRGELAKNKDPEALARLLITGIYGLRVYFKTQPDPGKLYEIIDSLFDALDAAPVLRN